MTLIKITLINDIHIITYKRTPIKISIKADKVDSGKTKS